MTQPDASDWNAMFDGHTNFDVIMTCQQDWKSDDCQWQPETYRYPSENGSKGICKKLTKQQHKTRSTPTQPEAQKNHMNKICLTNRENTRSSRASHTQSLGYNGMPSLCVARAPSRIHTTAGLGASASARGFHNQGIRKSIPHLWFGRADLTLIPQAGLDKLVQVVDPYAYETDRHKQHHHNYRRFRVNNIDHDEWVIGAGIDVFRASTLLRLTLIHFARYTTMSW